MPSNRWMQGSDSTSANTPSVPVSFLFIKYRRKPCFRTYSNDLQQPGLVEIQGYLCRSAERMTTPSENVSARKASYFPPLWTSGAA
eukprot:Skav230694  [mRNA]  locus=scaffold4706:22968:27369:- [translate_table: standard]